MSKPETTNPYEIAIRALNRHIWQKPDGTFTMAVDAADVGIDPVIFAHLKCSMEVTNEYVRKGLYRVDDEWHSNDRPPLCGLTTDEWQRFRHSTNERLHQQMEEIERMRYLLADLYPIMKAEHDAGDGHFSTEDLERVKQELPRRRGGKAT